MPSSQSSGPLSPSPSTLIKLGSIVRHVEEALSPTGHSFDWTTVEGLLEDPDVQAWMAEADALALLPVRR